MAMYFPKYWAKASSGCFSCWRWSDASQTDAATKASSALEDIRRRFTSGELRHEQYDYHDRPVREALINRISGKCEAAITRNRYGSLILNTENLPIIDIDEPQPAEGALQKLSRLFTGKSGALNRSATIEDKLKALVDKHSGWGFRLYATKAGFRALCTHTPLAIDTAETFEMFTELGADPLYVKLCKRHNTFRARLTPKPWRCGCTRPPVSWPFQSEAESESFARWERSYANASEMFATCRFLGSFGSSWIHRELQPLIEYHDQLSRSDSSLPLA